MGCARVTGRLPPCAPQVGVGSHQPQLISLALENETSAPRIRRNIRMPGLYYEEFSVGQEFEHPWTRTVTEADNVLFSTLTMNVQPLHLDAHFSEKTEFGQ